jgi:single-strand DNA-binding protein
MNGIEAALEGRLGKNPELRQSQQGQPWLPLNVAVGEGDAVQWVGVAVFGERAQQLASSLRKGDRIYAEGRLRLETWTGQDGKERSGLKIAAWRVERLGEIGRSKPPKPKAPPEGNNPAPASAGAPSQRDWQRPLSEDVIPFAPAR